MRGLTVAAGITASIFGSSALAAGKLVGTAGQFEKFQTILETTEGSAKKAGVAMDWVTNFAVKTPYELDTVMDSFVRLRANGLDPTNGMLKTLGDTSAANGQTIDAGGRSHGRCGYRRERAVKGIWYYGQQNRQKYYLFIHQCALVKTVTASVKAGDRLAIQSTLMKIWSDRFGSSMQRLAGTWEGMTSNLADLWMKFQLMIMKSGLFDWMKGKLSGVLETITKMEADGSLQQWATKIGRSIQTVLEGAWAFAVWAADAISTLSGYLKMAAQYVGGWENLAWVLGGIAFGPALISTAVGIMQIAAGVAALGAALFANPIGLAIAAIAAGAALLIYGWEPVKGFFVDLWGVDIQRGKMGSGFTCCRSWC